MNQQSNHRFSHVIFIIWKPQLFCPNFHLFIFKERDGRGLSLKRYEEFVVGQTLDREDNREACARFSYQGSSKFNAMRRDRGEESDESREAIVGVKAMLG